jgi:hypothetical protein
MNKLVNHLELSRYSLEFLYSNKPSIDGCEPTHSFLRVSRLELVNPRHRQPKSADPKAINIIDRYTTKSPNALYGLRCTNPGRVIRHFNNRRGVSHAISITR